MSAETQENSGVKEQEAAAPVAESEAKQSTSSAPQPGSKEYNWREMERKNRQLEQELLRVGQLVDNQARSQIPQPKDELADLNPDDIVTFSQAQKIAEKRAAQYAEEIVKREMEKIRKESLPQAVKAQYKDFDQIVTEQNLENLIKEDPSLESAIKNHSNPYEFAYKQIRKADFYRSNNSNLESEARLKANSEKPISSNAVKQPSPAAQGARVSREELWKEMCRFKNGSI